MVKKKQNTKEGKLCYEPRIGNRITSRPECIIIFPLVILCVCICVFAHSEKPKWWTNKIWLGGHLSLTMTDKNLSRATILEERESSHCDIDRAPIQKNAQYLPPEHSDFVFDTRLLPLQGLFGNALDCDHLFRGLLPSHHHFRKRSAARERERERETWLLHMHNGHIDTENLFTVSRQRALRGTQARVHKQHIVNIYWELAKFPHFVQQPSALAYARVLPEAWQTLLKPLKNSHLGWQIACLRLPSVSIHESAFKNKYGIKEVFAHAICTSCYDTALSPP